MDSLLVGQEVGIEAAKFARLVGDPMRPSKPLRLSPQVQFLQQYLEIGDALLNPEELKKTAYYKNAFQCIDIVGNYFEARSEVGIPRIARRFIEHFDDGGPIPPHVMGQSLPDSPIRVRPIRHSSCFQIVDGHHRLAINYVRGIRNISVQVESPPVETPLQSILLDVLWQHGRLELYQPVDSPELMDSWVIMRKCADRKAKMLHFLDEQGLLGPNTDSYLDLGSSYGWFVSEMGKVGFHSHGVERDPIAVSVGPLAYGLDPTQITRSDLARFLKENQQSFDVVSCFSILHHFILGNGSVSAEELIGLIDGTTAKVLFLDTGQEHEIWYRERLRGWNPESIAAWLEQTTSFSRIFLLGADEDSVPPMQGNFGRMLFACLR